MKIVKTYSHLNGLEYLLVHKKNLWLEVLDVIGDIDATQCKTKVSKLKCVWQSWKRRRMKSLAAHLT